MCKGDNLNELSDSFYKPKYEKKYSEHPKIIKYLNKPWYAIHTIVSNFLLETKLELSLETF